MQKKVQKQWKIHSEPGAPTEAIVADAESLPDWTPVESSPNTTVFRFSHAGRTYFGKTYSEVSPDRLLKDIFRGIWIERAVRIQEKMRHHGFKAPAIACYGRKGMRGTIIYAEVQGRALADWQDELDPETLARVCAELGRCIGRFHRAGFFHGDLHIGNIFMADPAQPDFVFLDNERSKKLPRLPWIWRRKNLSRLLYSLKYYRTDADALWEEFYKSYCSESPAKPGRHRRWEMSVGRKVEQMIAAKQDRSR
jgi:tRNA A-37 threonylcarbamoyl transferase component Bud32